MRNPLVLYLVGAAILSAGLLILLMAREIAAELGRLWKKSLAKVDPVIISKADFEMERRTRGTRIVFWRVLGALITLDGLVWLVRATEAAFRFMPHARR